MEVTKIDTEERLPWHKPELQRLTVSLDTGYRIDSVTDLGQTGAIEPQ